MHNGPRTVTTNRQSRPAASFDARPRRFYQIVPIRSALRTRKETMSGISRSPRRKPGPAIRLEENYYQHAEHYFRSMSADRETT